PVVHLPHRLPDALRRGEARPSPPAHALRDVVAGAARRRPHDRRRGRDRPLGAACRPARTPRARGRRWNPRLLGCAPSPSCARVRGRGRLATTAGAARMTADAQQVHRVAPGGTELGFVVVDSSIQGRARGGLRIVPEVTEVELRAAARAMTLKYGLLGLPQGGAKAGLHGDPDAPVEERRARMLAFARAIEPLLRTRGYVPDADIGTRADDIRWTMQALGLRVGANDWQANRSGQYTAASCVAAARAALAHRGATLRDCRVAIEGFGSVGAAVADGLRREGARVVAVSTSRGALRAARIGRRP